MAIGSTSRIWRFLELQILPLNPSSIYGIFKLNSLLIILLIKFRLSDGDKPFDAVVTIPKLIIKAKYTSSGVLIIIPASGGGEFNAVFGKNFYLNFL